jgi:putative zinc finger/helix-turn-helix YgiT family protein
MKKQRIILDIPIPTSDGKSVAYTIPVEVAACYDEELHDYILDGAAMAEIDRMKARHMGLLTPEEIKALRTRLGVTQREIAKLLQIGEKSWSRWENGRERPSRSMNILLRSLWDGKVDVGYLRSIRKTEFNWWPVIRLPSSGLRPHPYTVIDSKNEERCDATKQFAA